MRIATKFNLVLFTIMSIALAGTGYFTYTLLQKNAQREVIDHAGMMMETALAIRGYTVSQVRPLLKEQMAHTFLPQSVPAYAATQSFETLRKNPRHKEYSYKEATINPTNLNNRATDWENDIIRAFRNDITRDQILTVRNTADGPLLHLARPIRIKKEGCLVCHGRPENAPKTMLALYNSRTNGFGWKLNETVGAQIVTVPTSVPSEAANKAFLNFMLVLVGIFAFIFLALNILLRKIIIKPIIRMASQANEVSMGKMSSPEFNEQGKDELSTLGASFNRMRRSLQKAMKMIEDEGKGVILYMNQEGRGIGLFNKMKAYKLQEEGRDTIQANVELGFRADERDYGVGANILRELNLGEIRLMTNNPVKRAGLEGYGLKIIENVHLESEPNPFNEFYLQTKKEKMGHVLELVKPLQFKK